MILYEKGGLNKDLTEINDPAILDQIRCSLNLSPSDLTDMNKPPFILGTVSNHGYQRKLKMMPCHLFTLLSICHSPNYVDNFNQYKHLKKGVN